MVLTIEVDDALTGNELIAVAKDALESIRYNIGPERLRETRGKGYAMFPTRRDGKETCQWELKGIEVAAERGGGVGELKCECHLARIPGHTEPPDPCEWPGRIIVQRLNTDHLYRLCETCAHDALASGLFERENGSREALRMPGWISVGERLPERAVPVLIASIDEYGIAYSVLHRSAYAMDDRWLDVCGTKSQINVTHWQPLPAPPEAQ